MLAYNEVGGDGIIGTCRAMVISHCIYSSEGSIACVD
jgi:hypothetical protein